MIDIQTNSFKQQRRLLTELQSLRNEAQAEEDAAEKERLDAIAANLKEEEKIRDEANKKKG